MLQKTGISSGSYDPVGSMLHFFYLRLVNKVLLLKEIKHLFSYKLIKGETKLSRY